MCRHLAYWGPPATPVGLVLDHPYALLRQCTTAREMSWGQDNLDGWGFAWQPTGEPIRSYRSALSLADDAAGRSLLSDAWGERFIVHVRQKTPGSATDAVNSAPFTDGAGHFFAHNGFVADFRNGVREQLLSKVSPMRASAIEGDTDSEALFALVLSRLDDGASPSEAAGAVADVADLFGGRYNILLWADDTIVATRWENSLYVRDAPDHAVVSSEPTDDGEWRPVPERSMVILTHDGVRQETL
jgi:glutamine amidotransferase